MLALSPKSCADETEIFPSFSGSRSTFADHAVAFLVEHSHIVDDDSVEETQVDPSHAHFCSEFLGEGSGYGRAEEGLYWWQVQQYDEYHIKGEDSPDDTADDMFKSFQSLMNI